MERYTSSPTINGTWICSSSPGEWGDLYKAFLKEKPNQAINDQPFFRVAAYKGDIRIATLTREYNCKYRGQGYLNGPVKIIHGHIDLRLDTAHVQGALKVLNAAECTSSKLLGGW
jgi:hypothetical protein